MDSLIPYYNSAVDSIADVLAPYVSQKQLDDSIEFLKDNDKNAILITAGALAMATLYIISGGNTKKNKKNKQSSKSRKVKIKKEKVIPVDPIKFAYDTINKVKRELQETFIPQIDKLEQDVAIERNGNNQESVKKDDNRISSPSSSSSSYKEGTEYRQLYLNESLLKLLMNLDSVETQGIEDIRTQRKATIKEVQVQCKRIDALKK